MRCRTCRHSTRKHIGLWCDKCEDFCCPPDQDIDEEEGEPSVPLPEDSKMFRPRPRR